MTMPCPEHLHATPFITSTDPAIVAFAREAIGDARDERERAVRLYYAVRDGVRYDPWSVDLTPEGFTARRCLAERRGFCITKSALLAAAARASGIPARLGFADVRNHLATPRLLEVMKGRDVFVWHAYTDIWVGGQWVKATPAFNRELCARFRVPPLEWDGRSDSLFQPFNDDRRPFMEYVRDRGTYDDVPFDLIASDFLAFHGGWIEASAAARAKRERPDAD
jgi:transglutaminase-like putative cysteine protease